MNDTNHECISGRLPLKSFMILIASMFTYHQKYSSLSQSNPPTLCDAISSPQSHLFIQNTPPTISRTFSADHSIDSYRTGQFHPIPS